MSEDKTFQEAIQAISEGQRERARDLLTGLLRNHSDNPEYWLWLSSVVDSISERTFCLESVIKLDPENKAAQRGLALLRPRPAGEEVIPVPPIRRKWNIQLEEEPPKNLLTRLWQNPVTRLVTLLASGVLLVGLLLVGFYSYRMASRDQIAFVRVSITPKPTLRYTKTPTPAPPTKTAVVRSPTPTFIGPTPLWMFLKETYTPMPRYVNTPHPVLEAYRIAMRNYERGDLPKMLTFLQQAGQSDPTSADIQYYIGEAYRLQERYTEARDAYLKAIQANPNFAPAYVGQAQVDLALNPGAQVLELFQKAIDLDPNYPDAYLERAAYFLNRAETEPALQDLQTLEGLRPYDPRLFMLRAQALLALGENTEALENAKKANEMDLTLLDSYKTLAQAYMVNQMPALAVEPAQIYLRYEDQDADVWLVLGQALFQTDQQDEAFKALTRAVDLNQHFADAYWYLGLISLDQDQAQSAVNYLVEAVRLKPDSFVISLDLGRALFAARRMTDAYRQLRNTENLAQTDTEKGEVFYWRGQVLEAAGNPKAAQLDYEALLALPAESLKEEWIRFARQRLLVINPPTPTPTSTMTPSATPTVTLTPTRTSTPSPTATATPRPSITPTPSRTSAMTSTPTIKPTVTSTRTIIRTPTRTPTPTRKP